MSIVDGKLCGPELREWLLSSADISPTRIDELLKVLDANEVDNVRDLARWAKMSCFDTSLMPMTRDKIREALASWAAGRTGDPPAERSTPLSEEASPPATPTRIVPAAHPQKWADDAEMTPPAAPRKPAIRRGGGEVPRRVLFASPAVVTTSCAAVVVQSAHRGQLGRRRADDERLRHRQEQCMKWQREEWRREARLAGKIQRAWRLRLWGRVRGPLVPPWFWGEGPVLEVLSLEQRKACEDPFWHTPDECAALDLHGWLHGPAATMVLAGRFIGRVHHELLVVMQKARSQTRAASPIEWAATIVQWFATVVRAATTIQLCRRYTVWRRQLHAGDDEKTQATDVQGATPSARAPAGELQEGTVPAIIPSSKSPTRHGCQANGTLDSSNISSCTKDAVFDSSQYLLAHLATQPYLPRRDGSRPDAGLPYGYRCPSGAFDAVAWYDAWLRGASLRGLPVDSDDSDSADDTYSDFDDPRSRAQLVTRWLHQVLSTDFVRMKAALTKVPHSIDDFEIDARLPADEQLNIFARYGWLDGPPSPLYVQRRMVQLARERYERALASAERLHPGKTVTFPMTFAGFEKARSWEAGGGFYFIAPRGGKKEMRQQGDAALDEAMDETDLLEY